MKINTVVEFDDKKVSLTDFENKLKTYLKENKITQKEIVDVHAYVKPEAIYVVLENYLGDMINITFPNK